MFSVNVLSGEVAGTPTCARQVSWLDLLTTLCSTSYGAEAAEGRPRLPSPARRFWYLSDIGVEKKVQRKIASYGVHLIPQPYRWPGTPVGRLYPRLTGPRRRSFMRKQSNSGPFRH